MASYARVSCLRGFLYCMVFGCTVVGMAEITTGAACLTYRGTPEAVITYQNGATPGASLIVAGTLLLLASILGFIGATRVTWPWLCVLGAALSLLTALQIVIAVVGFVEASTVQRKVNNAMYYSLKHYDNNYYRSSWDSVQTNQHCCGVKSFIDWDIFYKHRPSHGRFAPYSCCALPDASSCTGDSRVLYRTGCYEILSVKAKDMLTTGAALAVSAASLQLLGIMTAILLSTIYQEKPGYQLY